MKTVKETVEEFLDRYASSVDLWIMYSRMYDNMGTYHLMNEDALKKSIDYRFAINSMEWAPASEGGLLQSSEAKLYHVDKEWGQLLRDLHRWATSN